MFKSGTLEVTDPGACNSQRREVERQLRKCAGIAHDLDLPRRDRARAIVVPHGVAGRQGHPSPTEDVLHRDIGKRLRGYLQGRLRGRVSIGDQQGEPVEQQVERTWGSRRGGRAWVARANLKEDALSRELAGDGRRAPCGQVGLASELEVRAARGASRPSAASGGASLTRPEAKATLPRSRSSRAHWNSSSAPVSAVAASPRAVSNAPAKKLASAAAIERSARRAGSLVERDGALQEGSCGGNATACLRATGGLLQLERDVFVRAGRCRSEMPRSTVGIHLPIGRLCQRQMHRPALFHRCGSVHRRANERMTEPHRFPDRE